MDIYEDIDPVELTGYARAALDDKPENQATLDDWLPDVTISDLEFRVRTMDNLMTETAEYRAYDTESPLDNGTGFSDTRGEIPVISRKTRMGEYARLRRDNLSPEIKAKALSDTDRLVRMIRNRVAKAKFDLARTGSVTLAENGVAATFNWNRDASMSVAPATVWTNVGAADPFGDELGWVETYADLNGFRPGVALMNSVTRRMAALPQDVRDMAPKGLLAPSRITARVYDELREEQDLPPVVIVDRVFKTAGVNSKAIPDGQIIYLPPAGEKMGETFWGVTAESLELDIERQEQPGITAVAYKSVDPVALWTNVSAVAIPTAVNVNYAMRLTVN